MRHAHRKMHEEMQFVHVSTASQWHTQEWSCCFYVLTSYPVFEMQWVTPGVLQMSGLHSTNASILVNCSVIYLCCSWAIQPHSGPMEPDSPPAPQFFKLDQETNLVLIKVLQTAASAQLRSGPGLRRERLALSSKYHLTKAQPVRACVRCLGIAQNKARPYK